MGDAESVLSSVPSAAAAAAAAVAWASGLQVGYSGPLWPPLSLSIRRGERWVVLGRNGSGKSTFLRALLGLRRPLAGSVGRRLPVGYIAQDASGHLSMPCRVLDVVAGGAEVGWSFCRPFALRRTRALAALAQMQLEPFAARPLEALSEGQRQRVWMARAIACRPAWLVLDEPTSAMDAGFAQQMLAEVNAWCSATGGAALLAGHHTPALLAFCSHIFVAEAGSGSRAWVVAGPRAEVLAEPRVMQALRQWGGCLDADF